MPPEKKPDLIEMLSEECEYFDNQQPTINETDFDSRLKAVYKHIHHTSPDRAALCLSGGGIRSATFALGVIQGLALKDKLNKFSYISTVSGGGYIGSWLMAWVRNYHRSHENAKQKENAPDANTTKQGQEGHDQKANAPFTEVSEQIKSSVNAPDYSVPELQHLRSYSNYLTPHLGLVSADSWTLIAIYIRNLLLNWIILVPLLTAFLMLPIFLLDFSLSQFPNIFIFLVILGMGILGVLAIDYHFMHRPSFGYKESEALVLLRFLLPAVLCNAVATLNFAWTAPQSNDLALKDYLPLMTSYWWACLFTGLFYGAGFLRIFFKTARSRRMFLLCALAIAIMIVGTAIYFMNCWASSIYSIDSYPETPFWGENARELRRENAKAYMTLAFPALVGLYFLIKAIFAGVVSRTLTDDDNEWYERVGAWLLIVIAIWATLFTASLYGTDIITWVTRGPWWRISLIVIASVVLMALSWRLISAMIYRENHPASRPQLPIERPFHRLFLLAAALFCFLVLCVLGFIAERLSMLGANWLDGQYNESIRQHAGWFDRLFGAQHWMTVQRWVPDLFLIILLVLISVAFDYFININKISLHALYRNRLIRAYLAASHQDRNPSPFTDFDENDNFKIHELRKAAGIKTSTTDRKTPLLVINIALNMVQGHELAWQQRKAMPFTVTPLHCGSSAFEDVDQKNKDGSHKRIGCYRDSQEYGGGQPDKHDKPQGISVGTAMTISGAYASPNMGYYSSLPASFLMAIFNIRLGWWLGNPANNKTFTSNGPRFSLVQAFQELLGLTNARQKYVYLSDGGHFENLGLYEMVLRRCRFILVCDASCDPHGNVEDLASAIRKVKVDLGIDIFFPSGLQIGTNNQNPGMFHYGIGIIDYKSVDDKNSDDVKISNGVLLYLKTSCTEDDPIEVSSFSRDNPSFPHDTTRNQWFSESRFESYRLLGLHAILTCLKQSERMGSGSQCRRCKAPKACSFWRSLEQGESHRCKHLRKKNYDFLSTH